MQISILQWNVWVNEDIHNVAKFLAEHPADIICLQELTIRDKPKTGHGPDFIAEQLGYNHFYKQIDVGDDNVYFVNSIFSRYMIVSSNWEWINKPTGTGNFDDQYRAYVEVTLDVDGQELTVATTHMSFTTRFVSTPRKEQEADRLATILQTKKDRFIFTGDLNATPDSPTVQKISGILKNVGPDLSLHTWTTKPFSYDGFKEKHLNWRLDYIFATPDITPQTAGVLVTDYSDHLPILAVVLA